MDIPEDLNLDSTAAVFLAFLVLCLSLQVVSWLLRFKLFEKFAIKGDGAVASLKSNGAASSLSNAYIPAFLLATSADWMSGPYLYAIFKEYGYGEGSIAKLFMVGYLSSATIGT